jgi:hypothetical protein
VKRLKVLGCPHGDLAGRPERRPTLASGGGNEMSAGIGGISVRFAVKSRSRRLTGSCLQGDVTRVSRFFPLQPCSFRPGKIASLSSNGTKPRCLTGER